MTFERTGLHEPTDGVAVVVTSPRNETGQRDYWFARRLGVWVPTSTHLTAHALRYARRELDEPVLNRRLGDGQLRLSDFSGRVENRDDVRAGA